MRVGASLALWAVEAHGSQRHSDARTFLHISDAESGRKSRDLGTIKGEGSVAKFGSVGGHDAHAYMGGYAAVNDTSAFNPLSRFFSHSVLESDVQNSSNVFVTEASADAAMEDMRHALKVVNETSKPGPDHHKGSPHIVKPVHKIMSPHSEAPVQSINASGTGKSSGAYSRNSSAIITPVDRTCHLGVEDDCQSVCRWLKLVAKDEGSNATCPLFEWSLKSCGYELPEARDHHTDPLDCTIKLLRLDVLSSDMNNYIHQLEDCVHGLPTSVRDRCHVAVDLLTNEMGDWGKTAELKASVDGSRQRLQLACSQATAALESKTYEQEAIESLSFALSEAEKLPGHYLSKDLHSARELLDKLGPLPAARAELKDAIEGGKHALVTKASPDVSEAFVRLNVSVTYAEDLGLGSQLHVGKEMLADLGRLHGGLAELERTTFEGNVSLGERGDLAPVIRALNASILAGENMDLPHSSMSPAKGVLERLDLTRTTMEALLEATDRGRNILAAPSNARSIFRAAVAKLNVTIADAEAIGAGSDRASVEAVQTHDRLAFSLRAREALHKAIADGKEALLENTEMLENGPEIVVQHNLEIAIQWAKDAGLHQGLPVAKQVVHFLRLVDGAKQNMTQALAQANATLDAKSGGEALPIHSLQLAIGDCVRLKLSGGVADANARLVLLNSMRSARRHLDLAQAEASASLNSKHGEDHAFARLNASIYQVQAAGLDSEATAAAAQLEKLKTAVEARERLAQTLQQPLPKGSAWPELNGTILESVDLPDVVDSSSSGSEDGADIAEHLKALNDAIAEASGMGVADPDLELQLRRLTGMRDAYEQLQAATTLGERAMSSKALVDSAMAQLAKAVGEAKGRGLRLGVARGVVLLGNLSRIEPAREELSAAVIEANISHRTMSHMAEAQVRLDAAVAGGRELGLPVKDAAALSESLSALKAGFVGLQAAVVQGQIALDREEGEEEAISSLRGAVQAAGEIGIYRDVPVAVDLIEELGHMNAEHQQIATAVDPERDSTA